MQLQTLFGRFRSAGSWHKHLSCLRFAVQRHLLHRCCPVALRVGKACPVACSHASKAETWLASQVAFKLPSRCSSEAQRSSGTRSARAHHCYTCCCTCLLWLRSWQHLHLLAAEGPLPLLLLPHLLHFCPASLRLALPTSLLLVAATAAAVASV